MRVLHPDNIDTSQSKGILVILAAILMFSGVDVLNKVLGQQMSVVQILWARFVLFVPIALCLAYTPGKSIRWRSQKPTLQGIRACLLVVEMGMFVYALKFLPLADMQAILAMAPLMVVVLSIPILGEKVGWRRWSSVALGFCGVLIIIKPGFSEINMGTWIALGGMILWSFYCILLRIVGQVDRAATTAVWTSIIGLILTSLVIPWYWVTPSIDGWWLLLAIALLGCMGHVTFMHAFTLAPASLLQPFTYVQIVIVTFLGWFFFQEIPQASTLFGAGLIVLAGIYSFHRSKVLAEGDDNR